MGPYHQVFLWYKTRFRQVFLPRVSHSVVIEDTSQNIFGCFISIKIQKNVVKNDPNCFVFSLKKNNELREQKFMKFNSSSDCYICIDKDDILLGVGSILNKSKEYHEFEDICIHGLPQKSRTMLTKKIDIMWLS